MEAEILAEVRSDAQALSSDAVLIGMLLMLDPCVVFSEESLRKFMCEQNRWQPEFENLFRARLSVNRDKADGLEERLTIFLGMLLVEEKARFRVRRSIKEVVFDQLIGLGILPVHEEQLKREATRFIAFIMQSQ